MIINSLKSTVIAYSLISIAMTYSNCVAPEPISHGDYFITNNTVNKLIVTAFGNFGTGEVELLANEIYPAAKIHIYTYTDASGGHVMPSNAWDEFYIYSEYKSDSTTIYSGIDNSDWEFEGANSDRHLIYNLTIE
jgi:hypothetical protein